MQCGTAGRLRPSGYLCGERDGDHVVECEDDMGGVAVEEKVKVFDTGFEYNTGLSLALSRKILDITGITIIETGKPGKGVQFEMIVPKAAYRFTTGAY